MNSDNIVIGQVTNDYLDYILDEIETTFNEHYGIFHENVLIIVDSSHNIDVPSIAKHSRILNYNISNELLTSKSKLLFTTSNLLLIQFKKGHFSEVKPNLFVPELICFSSNGSQKQNLSGNLFPSYVIKNEKVIFTKPKSFFICEFDIE